VVFALFEAQAQASAFLRQRVEVARGLLHGQREAHAWLSARAKKEMDRIVRRCVRVDALTSRSLRRCWSERECLFHSDPSRLPPSDPTVHHSWNFFGGSYAAWQWLLKKGRVAKAHAKMQVRNPLDQPNHRSHLPPPEVSGVRPSHVHASCCHVAGQGVGRSHSPVGRYPCGGA
jgi:hypothetical protein